MALSTPAVFSARTAREFRDLSADVLRQSLARIFDGDVGSFLHFLDVRKWMEAMTAAEAAERATVEDIGQIETTLPRLRLAASQNDREALDEADVATTWSSPSAHPKATPPRSPDYISFGSSHQRIRTWCERHGGGANACFS